jgi:hypothetical protein
VAAQDGDGRAHRRNRHDRARGRLGPPGRQDARRPGGKPLPDQRLQDLHHQRPARQPRHRRDQDGPGEGRQGHLADRGGDRRGRRVRARSQPRQGGAEVQRHVGALLQRRARADRQPARARGRPGLRPAHAAASAGAPADRHRRDLHDRAGAGPGCLFPKSPTRTPPNTPASASRAGPSPGRRRRTRRPIRSSSTPTSGAS